MQTATVDLLDIDPFELVADEVPWGRVTAHLPGKHPQERHAGDGPDLADLALISGIDVMDQDAYHKEYGDVHDERSVDLGDGYGLTVRYFQRGDSHVVIDMPGDHYQVLEDMGPEPMRRLSYDIDDALAADLDEPDDTGIAFDIDSEAHEFYIARHETGDVRLHPGGFGADHLNLSEDDAAEFAEALRDMADGYEEEIGVVEAAAAPVIAHRPGGKDHDQSSHGRKRMSLPDLVPPPNKPEAKKPSAAKPARKSSAPDSSKTTKTRTPGSRKATPKPGPTPKPAANADYVARRRVILDSLLRNSTDPDVLDAAEREWNDITGGEPHPRLNQGDSNSKPSGNTPAEAHVDELVKVLPVSLRPGVSEALKAQAAIVPSMVERFKRISFDDLGSGFAQYVPGEGIRLNDRWKSRRKQLDDLYRNEQRDGYLTPTGLDSGLGAAVAHEFGHHVAIKAVYAGNTRMMRRNAYDRVVPALARSLGIDPPKIPPGAAAVDNQKINDWLRRNSIAVKRGVSGYATESIHELLAEVWQEYSTRGKNARPAARAVGDVMRRMAGG